MVTETSFSLYKRYRYGNGADVNCHVTGAGVEFLLLRHLRIAPTVRYTYWAADDAFAFGGLRRNQTEFLVGFSF